MDQVRPPRVALVHDFLHTFGGAERVLQTMHALYPAAPIYTTRYDKDLVKKHFPDATFVSSSLQHSPLGKRPELLLSKYPAAVEEWDFSSFDLVLSSSGAFSHGIITGPDTTHICYCHSPMRYAWDWHAENLTERGLNNSTRGIVVQRMMSKLRLWDAVSAKRVDHWIANSTVVKERIAKYYRADATVIYPPVKTTACHSAQAREGFALSIGRLSPNKRLEQVISACHAVGIPLTIVGTGTARAALEAHAKKQGATVQFLGTIDESEKYTLLGKARCFIFAAEDDFGIAPVEALASGTPVIALDKGGVTETVKNGVTGILYPEQSVESLTEALQDFLANGVRASSSEIQASAQRFSTENFKQSLQTFIATHA